jgi:hypothetical protein
MNGCTRREYDPQAVDNTKDGSGHKSGLTPFSWWASNFESSSCLSNHPLSQKKVWDDLVTIKHASKPVSTIHQFTKMLTVTPWGDCKSQEQFLLQIQVQFEFLPNLAKVHTVIKLEFLVWKWCHIKLYL